MNEELLARFLKLLDERDAWRLKAEEANSLAERYSKALDKREDALDRLYEKTEGDSETADSRIAAAALELLRDAGYEVRPD